jgi:hypothetical protein
VDSAVRGIVHLAATATLLPYVLLATAFLLLDHALAGGSLLALLATLLREALWLIPWGMLAFVSATIALAMLGLIARTRWLGGLLLCLLALASVAVLIVKSSSHVEIPELIVLVPCIAVGAYGGWIAFDEWPSRRTRLAATLR